MNSHRPFLLALSAASLLTSLAGHLAAQIPIGGNVTGTLAAGVYVANNHITVPLGQTLTLSPGVIVKFPGGYEVTIHGQLIANGLPGNPVVFTAYADDTIGGNTNGGGASVGSPAAWRGLNFLSTSSASVLQYTEVRYGGSGYLANFNLNAASPTFVGCTSRNNYSHGMQLNGTSYPTVSYCAFVDNAGVAVDGVALAAVPGFTANTASGNGTGDYLHVTTAALTAPLAIEPADVLGGALMVQTHIDIAAGASLTLQAGVVVKFQGGYEVTVNGSLFTNGTAGSPVVFTDDADDTAGGNTNGGSASVGAPASWRGLNFLSTSGGSVLHWAEVRYGGSGYLANFNLNAASPTFVHCTSRNNYSHGMQLNGTSYPTVTNCAFVDNAGVAVDGVALAAVPGFTDNTASGNGTGDYLHVTTAALTAPLAIEPADVLGGALMVQTHIDIAAGASLTLQAGTVLKFQGGYEVTVNGSLFTNGTAGSPVVFTDDADDTAGGNTNGGAASVGAPGSWRGLNFLSTSGGSVLHWAEVRYGGSGYLANFNLNAASPTFVGCTSRNNYSHGMQLNGTSYPTVTNCTFANNSGVAVDGVALAAVPGFTNNSASGNGTGNYMHVTTAAVDGYLKIGPQSILEGALMLQAHLTVAPTGWLVVEQGVNCKFMGGYQVTVDGAIDLRGTGYEPIVFTDDADDSVAGDTNNNGASVGAMGSWRGILVNAGAPSRLENVVIRYTGSGYAPGLMSSSPNLTLRAVRVDKAYDRGFVLGALATSPTNLIAWGCNGHGIHLTGGAFDVVHATCNGNGTSGIRREVAWSGYVHNSNVWGNGANYANFGTGTLVISSNGGFPAVNSNVNVDPLFVDAANGDLHLGGSSPCLGLGQLSPAMFAQKDFDENSRILDHALVGFAAPDLGAFELPAWTMAVGGAARPGSTLTFTVSGPAGDSFLGWGLVDGAAAFLPWGLLLAGTQPGTSVALLYPVTIPVGVPIPLPLVNDPSLIGIAAGIQSLTLQAGNWSRGNFTRLYRFLIRA